MPKKAKLIKTGVKYRRLTVIANARILVGKRKRLYLLCECECGTIKEIGRYNLLSGKVSSCGCYNRENRKRMSANFQGENHPRWKGGRKKDQKGYVLIHAPNHPNSNSNGYIQEHRLIVEGVLGRPLKDSECVHHFDETKDNNENSNLVACNDWGYHQTLHKRTRALKRREQNGK